MYDNKKCIVQGYSIDNKIIMISQLWRMNVWHLRTLCSINRINPGGWESYWQHKTGCENVWTLKMCPNKS